MFGKFKFHIIIAVAIVLFIGICIVCISHIQQPFTAKIAYAQVNGAQLAYYTRGEGDPIVLLPGFGMTMADWDPVLLEDLAMHHKLIIFDYRGVGNSHGSIEKLTQKQMADDVIGLMGQLKIKKATLLGWSLGSFVAQVIAENHPAQVDKLILIGTGPGGVQQVGASDDVSTEIQNNLSGTWAQVYVPLMFASTDDKQAYLDRLSLAEVKKEVPTAPEESLTLKKAHEELFGDVKQEADRFKGLSKITAPTLILAGAQDKLILPVNDKLTAKQIHHAQFILIPEAGHAVLFEQAQQVAKLIESFLTKK